MQIRCKTLFLESFRIEANETDTMKEVKEKIETIKKFPIDAQRLMYLGKILSDKRTVASLTLDLVSVIIVMVASRTDRKIATKMKEATTHETKADAGIDMSAKSKNMADVCPSIDFNSSSSNRFVAKKRRVAKKSRLIPKSALRETWESDDNTIEDFSELKSPATPISDQQHQESVFESSTVARGEKDLEVVKKLLDMGFVKEKIVVALKASNNDSEQAVDILLKEASPSQKEIQQPNPKEKLSAKHMTTEERLKMIIGDPSVKMLRRAILENPELLNDLSEFLGDEYPALARTLHNCPNLFMKILRNEGDGNSLKTAKDDENKKRYPGVGVKHLKGDSLQEKNRRALEQLKSMGFSDDLAKKAYEESD